MSNLDPMAYRPDRDIEKSTKSALDKQVAKFREERFRLKNGQLFKEKVRKRKRPRISLHSRSVRRRIAIQHPRLLDKIVLSYQNQLSVPDKYKTKKLRLAYKEWLEKVKFQLSAGHLYKEIWTELNS